MIVKVSWLSSKLGLTHCMECGERIYKYARYVVYRGGSAGCSCVDEEPCKGRQRENDMEKIRRDQDRVAEELRLRAAHEAKPQEA